MKWQYAFSLFVLVVASVSSAATPKRTPAPAPPPPEDTSTVQPSGYVHIVQSTDRLASIAKYYKVSEEALRAVNTDLFAYNERETGHRLIINEPILLPMGCIIPRNAMYARRADALDKPAAPTVVTTQDSPAELEQLRSGSGWQTQYSRKTGKALPIFKPAAPNSVTAPTSTASQSASAHNAPLAYGITTSDLPSQKQSILGNAANRHVHLSSVFGERWGRHHKGIDIPFDENTPIVAAADGVVERADHDFMGYGNYVVVNHGRFETRYAHLNRIDVHPGQMVQAGVTVVGLSGSTGHSTGPHLHFEFRVDGEAVDPVANFLPGIQMMLRGMSNTTGSDQLQHRKEAGLESLNYTSQGDSRWQLNRTW